MKYILLKILITGLLTVFNQKQEETIVRIHEHTVQESISEIIPHIVEFNDTLKNDTLFEFVGENQIPLMYSRKILTEVCVDTLCRLLNIELFWTITGRYLGFELPEGEFLSKTEHVKFNSEEYDKLHLLLSNPQSELAHYSLKELIQEKDTTSSDVDAVSSATISAVLNYIVKGAVYTTYTLWHNVYGPAQREVEKLTSKKMNAQITLHLLNGENLSDKIWALNHFPDGIEIKEEMQSKFVEFISGSDVYLAERTLNALNAENLDEIMQNELVAIFNNTGFLQQRLILQKLMETRSFSENAAKKLSYSLLKLNGTLIKYALELFQIQNIDNETVSSNVALLLNNENRYISNQAFKYLLEKNTMDKKTRNIFEKYKRKNS